MILIDFSQIATGALTAEGYGANAPVLDDSYMRHAIINTIRSLRTKFHKEYGELVLCCDDSRYWRKEFFPNYKFKRKKEREESKIDWDSVKRGIDFMKREFKEYFPYPVVQTRGAEGDDIVDVLCEWSQSNDLQEEGIWAGEPKPLLIVSADGDLVQCQRFPNVKQYSPKMKKFLTPDKPMQQWVNEHIAEGDSGDSIMSVLNPDNCFVDKIRQKPLKKDRREQFIIHGIDACQTDEERKYYQRNQRLIDFTKIPKKLKEYIITDFESQLVEANKRKRMKVMSYLVKNKMSIMLESLGDF